MATTFPLPYRDLPGRRHGDAFAALGAALAFLVFFALAFPKGGFKIYGTPITFGYLFTPVLVLFALSRARTVTFPLDRLAVIAGAAVLTGWSAVTVAINGLVGADSGLTLAYFVSVAYLPVFGMVAFSGLTMDEFAGRIEQALLWAVRFAAAYGVFLFFFKMLTGQWIEVPFLTVNVDDVGQLDNKYIARGAIFKLISTYNNGNIFGVSMAILGPLYWSLEKSKVLRGVFCVAALLTLSRTSWIGLTLMLVMKAQAGRRLTMSSVLLGVMALLVAAAGVLGGMALMGADLSFLTDRELGGRAYQLDQAFGAGLVGDHPVSAIVEIVYASVAYNYGWAGLVLFVLYLALPAVLLRARGVRLLGSGPASACLQGLTIYLVLAGSDGVFTYIPVMMIFWMIAGLGLWYARLEDAIAAREPARRPSGLRLAPVAA
jgi:hypothetical protein